MSQHALSNSKINTETYPALVVDGQVATARDQEAAEELDAATGAPVQIEHRRVRVEPRQRADLALARSDHRLEAAGQLEEKAALLA